MLPIGPVIGIPNVEGGGESAPAIPLVHANEAAAFATLFPNSIQPANTNPIILDPTAPLADTFACPAQTEPDVMIDALAATNRAAARGITLRLPIVNPLVIHIEAIQQPVVSASLTEPTVSQETATVSLEILDTEAGLPPEMVFAPPSEQAAIAKAVEAPEIQNIIATQSDGPVDLVDGITIQMPDALQHQEPSKAVVPGHKLTKAAETNPITDIVTQEDPADLPYFSVDAPALLAPKSPETPVLQVQIDLLVAQSAPLHAIDTIKIADAGVTQESLPSATKPVLPSNNLPADPSEAVPPIERTELIQLAETSERQPETQTQLLADATRVDAIAASIRDLVSIPGSEQIDDLNTPPETIPHPSSNQPMIQETPASRSFNPAQEKTGSPTPDAHTIADLTQAATQSPTEPHRTPMVVTTALPQQSDGANAIRKLDVAEAELVLAPSQEIAQTEDSNQHDPLSGKGRKQATIFEQIISKDDTQSVAKHQQSLREEFRNVLKDIDHKTDTKLEGINSVNTGPALPQSDGQTTTSARALASDSRFSPMTETGSSESRAQVNELRMRALERQVVNAVKQGSDTIRMQLYPPGLGQIVIRLTAEGGRLRMITRTQSQEATDALRQVEQDLRNALGSDGLQLTEFDVSDHNDGDGRRQTQDSKITINRSAKTETFAIDMNA